MTAKIGFACKFSVNTNKGIEVVPELNVGGTTIAWLNRQSKQVAEQKLWDLMKKNIEAVRCLVEKVSQQDEHLRMVRIGSDILPAYTESSWSYFWRLPDVQNYAAREFEKVGNIARASSTRLSMHPGQFTVLASDNPEIVNKSIEEFEYHATMAAWMGYGKQFQDFKINVHISGRQGPDGIRKVLDRLSPEARNCITIENEEMSHGLDNCLMLADVVPIVLDVHHHWVREGEYIKPEDPRVARVIDSWRGVRPVMHYSISREDVLTNHSITRRPHLPLLLESGHSKQKLRAHSDYFWNKSANKWALSFLKTHDIMCESKAKNLASFELANEAKELGLI